MIISEKKYFSNFTTIIESAIYAEVVIDKVGMYTDMYLYQAFYKQI